MVDATDQPSHSATPATGVTQSRLLMPAMPLPKTGHSFMRVAVRFQAVGRRMARRAAGQLSPKSSRCALSSSSA
jgi:hypothetical protein